MPPRFDDCDVNTMKRTMLHRMPEYYFTEDDYTLLSATTQLSRAQIENWADHFRRRNTGAVQRETYLKNTEKDKVRFQFPPFAEQCHTQLLAFINI
jgi:hypothetical protein